MLPYDLIGRLTVALLLALLVEIAVVPLLLVFYVVWVRGWKRVMERMWRGYDPLDEPPPSPKRDIAIFAYGMYNFKKPSEIHRRIKEAHGIGTRVGDSDE